MPSLLGRLSSRCQLAHSQVRGSASRQLQFRYGIRRSSAGGLLLWRWFLTFSLPDTCWCVLTPPNCWPFWLLMQLDMRAGYVQLLSVRLALQVPKQSVAHLASTLTAW